jgi:hypothetical protein
MTSPSSRAIRSGRCLRPALAAFAPSHASLSRRSARLPLSQVAFGMFLGAMPVAGGALGLWLS